MWSGASEGLGGSESMDKCKRILINCWTKCPYDPLHFKAATRPMRANHNDSMKHMCVPATTVKSDQGVVFVTETVLHVCSVYPNAVAANLSCAVRAAHFVDTDAGCTSLPDALSHDTSVYPSDVAACCWLSCVVVTARAGSHKWGTRAWMNILLFRLT